MYIFKNDIKMYNQIPDNTPAGSFFIKSNNDDTTNNFNQFGVSSKSDIQKVINFFSFSGLHPLVGLKYIQYIKCTLNYPDAK
ncbi:hypothetical protein GE21DRAFT_1313840 [Neurospora crassa]|nr:hypothetical protein GE21DRAFT_1313840 [Neurospora crassa]